MAYWRGAVLALFIGMACPAIAVTEAERLPDPTLERRARALSSELRCLVCQNQSIDESDAELARDLRRLVRERIVAGEDDQAIRSFLVARYGDFVLLKPQFSIKTALLWGLPFLALAGGGVLAFSLFRRRDRQDKSDESILSEAEQRELDAFLDQKKP